MSRWAKLEAEAKRQLAASSAAIDASRSGTPAGRKSDYSLTKKKLPYGGRLS